MPKKLINNLMNRLPLPIVRFLFNIWPPFLGCGVKVTNISSDYRTFDIALKMHWYNRNYVGVHFGGSLFLMSDAFCMLILAKNLGSDYIVWDKAAKIDYLIPGRGTITARFEFTAEEIESIKNTADQNEKYVFDRNINLMDEKNEVVASVCKTLYVRKKN